MAAIIAGACKGECANSRGNPRLFAVAHSYQESRLSGGLQIVANEGRARHAAVVGCRQKFLDIEYQDYLAI